MKRHDRIRAQIALTTAICFASLAVLAPGAPARDGGDCALPAWAPAWISGLAGDDCR